MNIISHRGNLYGPNSERENSPSYIDEAIAYNFEVEIDLRLTSDGFRLGHDNPAFAIDEKWIIDRKNYLWIHCKNIQAQIKILELGIQINCFSHAGDPYVLMGNGFIWQHDINLPSNYRCIIPLIDKNDILNYSIQPIGGICTDYVVFCRDYLLKYA